MMHRSSNPQRASGASFTPSRYRLSVASGGGAVRIDDCRDARTVLEWRGHVARRLMQNSPLLRAAASCGAIAIGKQVLKRLALSATAIEYERSALHDAADLELQAAEQLWQRLREIDIRIPSFHARVAKVLFRYPGEHLSAADALCLTQLKFPNHDAEQLRECLDDLSMWGVVQRIAVRTDVFYDLDVAPHLHLFDARTRQLADAPTSGTLIR